MMYCHCSWLKQPNICHVLQFKLWYSHEERLCIILARFYHGHLE